MKTKIQSAIQSYIPLGLLLVLVFVLLRLYESLVVTTGQHISLLQAFWFDIVFALSFSGFLLLIYMLLALLNDRIAKVVVIVMMIIIVLGDFLLIKYFSITHIPLSKDLFAYSLNDIITTIKTSANVDVLSLILLAIFPLVIVTGSIFSARRISTLPMTNCYVIGGVMLICLITPTQPGADKFRNDQEYYNTVNKESYFIQRVLSGVREQKSQVAFKADDYPFLHTTEYKNTIGKYFNHTGSPPNFVFIIVEGLGRDFVGTDARYGGFTPFLDSLTGVSLYWRNALSNGGRTFAVLPSLLGSLPYGRAGFMSYGSEMPAHQTLISMLKPYGYKTSFFYGGNAHFDNMDTFLEYQQIDTLIDEAVFPNTFQVSEKNSEGFTWGYADSDLFDLGSKITGSSNDDRKVDIYLTLSTHEPFKVPDAKFHSVFDDKVREIENGREKIFLQYREVFECLAYTDDAIKQLFNRYRKLPQYDNTVFVITGDHRLIPVPQDSKTSRFHVPLIIFSPLLKSPQTFQSITAHSAVTPSLLSMLAGNYALTFPKDMPFMSDSLSTRKQFSSDLQLALMRNKNEVIDYISGLDFLSEGRLYKITPTMGLEPSNDEGLRYKLNQLLVDFKARSVFACENNRVDRVAPSSSLAIFTFTDSENKIIDSLNLKALDNDQLFMKARDLAFAKMYVESRVASRLLLNANPNYHDARILLARTFAWNSEYDTAEYLLKQVIKRAPKYGDAYAALADISFWKGNNQSTLTIVRQGLNGDPNSADLLVREARALWMLNKKQEAKAKINAVMKRFPDNELGVEVQKQIN